MAISVQLDIPLTAEIQISIEINLAISSLISTLQEESLWRYKHEYFHKESHEAGMPLYEDLIKITSNTKSKPFKQKEKAKIYGFGQKRIKWSPNLEEENDENGFSDSIKQDTIDVERVFLPTMHSSNVHSRKNKLREKINIEQHE
ncbi:hypothetical protein V1478_004037 [Vespula squamosa]|uniref:Uncharacterized protein n=1 Tax=Vespula squamosa TaxID=30214 RepID=A0ABD2BP35_VESSQ